MDALRPRHASVVDEDVATAHAPQHLRPKGCRLFWAAQVADHVLTFGSRAGEDLLQGCLAVALRSGADHHVAAGLGQPSCHRLAQALGAARDKGDATLYGEELLCSELRWWCSGRLADSGREPRATAHCSCARGSAKHDRGRAAASGRGLEGWGLPGRGKLGPSTSCVGSQRASTGVVRLPQHGVVRLHSTLVERNVTLNSALPGVQGLSTLGTRARRQAGEAINSKPFSGTPRRPSRAQTLSSTLSSSPGCLFTPRS